MLYGARARAHVRLPVVGLRVVLIIGLFVGRNEGDVEGVMVCGDADGPWLTGEAEGTVVVGDELGADEGTAKTGAFVGTCDAGENEGDLVGRLVPGDRVG